MNRAVSSSRALPAKLASAAPLFAALGDETRLAVIARLCSNGPQSIAELTDGARVTRQAMTKHLEALAEVGVLRSHRNGRQRIWELTPKRLVEVQRHLEMISSEWDRAIDRLRAMVEDDR